MKNTQDNIKSEKDATLFSGQINPDIQTNTSQKERFLAYLKSTDNLTAKQHGSGIDLP